MHLHLPFSESPRDEFQATDGQWHPVLRAVVFDSWLLWQHALPDDLHLRAQLTPQAEQGIRELGAAVHEAHQHFPDYKRLVDTPFRVSRWWDPTDDTGEWSSGHRLLCRVINYSAIAVEAEIKRKVRYLDLTVRSLHYIEVALPQEARHLSPINQATGVAAG
jgi:hypothetical protein